MRLRTTLLGLLVVIAVVLSGTIFVGFTLHKHDVRAQEQNSVEQTASVVAERLETRIASTTEIVDLWASSLADGNELGTRYDRLLTFLERTSFDNAELYTMEGELVSIAGVDLTDGSRRYLLGGNYATAPFVREALEGGVYIGDVGQTVTGAQIVRVATPIRDVDGDIVGVFSGNFELGARSLFANISAVGNPHDQVTITTGERTLFEESDRVERPITATTRTDQNWTVTVQRPGSTIAAELWTATAMQIGGVAVALLSVAIVGLWVSRTTIVRIRDLLAAFDTLEAGEYRTDLDLGSIQEWERISDRFNALAGTLKQRDSQLRVLNRVLRHNLRNDMNVITARAERILAEPDTSPEIEADAEQIHETATELINTSEHARTLYEELLAEPQRAIGPVDVIAVVEDRVKALGSQYPDVMIETDFPASAWALDSTTLSMVVEELVRNAIIHNDRPSAEREVRVTVSRDEAISDAVETDDEIRIEVADNGPGIPMIEEALLTDQLEESPIEHGSGLGVWVVNWLVEGIGGTVTIRTGTDCGTTVSVHLPAAAPPVSGESSDGQPDGTQT